MRVDLGRSGALVAQEFLDDPEVGAAFQQMRGEAVTEGVGREVLLDACRCGGILDDSLNGPGGQVATGTVTGEWPWIGGIGVPVDAHRFEATHRTGPEGLIRGLRDVVRWSPGLLLIRPSCRAALPEPLEKR